MRNKAKLSSAMILAALLVSQPLSIAPANAANVAQGRRLASLYCAKCHAIDKVSPSPLTIVVGHPTMPQFHFEPDQIGDFLAFLKTLE